MFTVEEQSVKVQAPDAKFKKSAGSGSSPNIHTSPAVLIVDGAVKTVHVAPLSYDTDQLPAGVKVVTSIEPPAVIVYCQTYPPDPQPSTPVVTQPAVQGDKLPLLAITMVVPLASVTSIGYRPAPGSATVTPVSVQFGANTPSQTKGTQPPPKQPLQSVNVD